MHIDDIDRYVLGLISDAYPVDNYIYMVKRPFKKPLFFQDAWDAVDYERTHNCLLTPIVKIYVRPISNKQQSARRLYSQPPKECDLPLGITNVKNYFGFFNMCSRHLFTLATIDLVTLVAVITSDLLKLGDGLTIAFAVMSLATNTVIIATATHSFFKWKGDNDADE